ncbi:MAG: hypothetical protein NC184_03830 [Roseburia sp.]|nr:hypothetical protein [Roseburia sp.]
MGNLLTCYHHSNCDDRPAVATCSNCGKGLCTECADKLHSPTTGNVLCVDCLNAELDTTVAKASAASKAIQKELITIGVGLVIGIIIAAIFGTLVTGTFHFVAFFIPTLCASFGTIWQMCRYRGVLVGILFFIGLMLVSPVIFVWRIVVRVRDIIALKKFADCQVAYRNANDNFFRLARSMKSEKIDPEAIRRELEVKYAALREQDAAEYEKKVKAGVDSKIAEREAEMEEIRKTLNEIKEQQNSMAGAMSGVDKASKQLGGEKKTHDREAIEV